ncbi:MAG: sugar ABC transporter ATP-binding protein, partial [Pseudomonadota bacterium]
MAALLELDGLSKSFFGVKALKGVTLSVEEGSVLGLVGENGAGKSTLMNLIGGIHAPTEGAMRMDGHAYAPRTAADAKAAGIAFIHQELNLFTNLSIAENVFIDGFPKRFGLIDRRAARTRTAELLGALDLDQSPDARVESLSPGERQLVEIAKALHRDARLIILDEPTTSLTARETVRLFETMDRLRARGVTMIYISHVLADVARLSTHVAVLRDGALVTTGTADAFDVPTMIQAMIGRELTQLFPPRTCAPGADIVLSVEKVSQPGVVKDVSLEVRRGEILGLFGLMGSGRSELARILFGLDDRAEGRIAVNGSELTDHGPTEAIAAGMAFVTENRREEGLLMEA